MDPQFKELLDKFKNIWNVEKDKIDIQDLDLKWAQMKAKIETDLPDSKTTAYRIKWSSPLKQRIPAFSAVRIFQVAAICVLLLSGSYFLIKEKPWTLPAGKGREVQYETTIVENGKRLTLSLSDGSEIILDSGSKIKYPLSFHETRDVYLEGEAFFKVKHDSERPFHVYANHALIKVLGTQFNVRVWNENPQVSVTVAVGNVSLQNSNLDNAEPVLLTKGKQSKVSEHAHASHPIDVDPDMYTNWINNEIHFENASLQEIIAQLQRWYNYEFLIKDTLLEKQRMTVHIEKSNVPEVIELIGMITDTEIIQEGKKIQLIKK
jgi:ferric-dicitrate binding protein FerR (iron transport regulator)